MKRLRCPKRDLFIAVSQLEMADIMSQGLSTERPMTYYRRQAIHDAFALYADIVVIRVNVQEALCNGIRFYAGDEADSFTSRYLPPMFLYVDSHRQKH